MLKSVGNYRKSWRIFLGILFGLQILCLSAINLINVNYHSLKGRYALLALYGYLTLPSHRTATLKKSPTIQFCTPTNTARWLPAWWIPMGIMDLILFVLALYVAIGHMREVQVFREMERRGKGAPVAINGGEGENLDSPKRGSTSVMELIIQDSIPYYVGCVFAASLCVLLNERTDPYYRLLILHIINSVSWLGLRHHSVLTSLSSDSVMSNLIYLPQANVSHIPQEFSIVFVAIFGSRMVLNMRHKAEESPARGGGSQFRLSGVDGMLQHIENSVGTGEGAFTEGSHDPPESGASSASPV